jgi:hypothetical protein
MIGCVLGVPCLTLRTWSVAVLNSTWSHRRSTSSETQAVPVSHEDHRGIPWPWRLPVADFISRSTSVSVKYSRVRRSPLRRRLLLCLNTLPRPALLGGPPLTDSLSKLN